MKCPVCGLFNPDSAQRCDCGYDFQSGKLKKSYVKPEERPFVTSEKAEKYGGEVKKKTIVAEPKEYLRWCPQCNRTYSSLETEVCPECEVATNTIEANRVFDPIHVTIMVITGLLFIPGILVLNDVFSLQGILKTIITIGSVIFAFYALVCWATKGKAIETLVPKDKTILLAKKSISEILLGAFGRITVIAVIAIVLLIALALIAGLGQLLKSC